ncbi:MAG: trehalose-6-phosphate synthase [Terriglobales bacterium]
MSSATRVIVVSNRLPVTVEQTDDGVRIQASCGGLVTALRPVLRENSGCWVGWTGADASPEVEELLRKHPVDSYSLVPLSLTPVERACFYHGCSNEIIWPLFHDLQSRCNFDPNYWDVYREVTEKFADAVERVAHKDDFVWVHDYHLMLLGDALQARDLRLKLAYFHHIPFPPPDIFEKLPWRNQILRGLLQFNNLGFQTARDCRNFIACLRRYLQDVHVRRLGEKLLVRAEGLSAVVGAYPISIDFHEFADQAAEPAVTAKATEIQRSISGEQIVLGVDRLDYTKGIPERLLAFRNLLQRYPELQGRITLVQVVVPSREEIAKYRELKLTIERLVSEINGEYSKPGWVPVVYLHRCLSRPELVAFYRAADIALVTPLKDGMNLIAKEFCASRVDEGGVLVLSEFAGAATELKCGALLVNPYDTEGVATALYRGFRMSGREQRVRMQRIRRYIQRHDVFRWCRSFCSQAVPLQFPAKVPVAAAITTFSAVQPRAVAGS